MSNERREGIEAREKEMKQKEEWGEEWGGGIKQ